MEINRGSLVKKAVSYRITATFVAEVGRCVRIVELGGREGMMVGLSLTLAKGSPPHLRGGTSGHGHN